MSDGAFCHYCRQPECRCHRWKSTPAGLVCERCEIAAAFGRDAILKGREQPCLTLREWIDKEDEDA